MLNTWVTRWLPGIFVILTLVGTVSVAAAGPPEQIGPSITDTDTDGDPDCRECHWPVYLAWEKSTHGKGLSCGQCHLGDQDNHAREGHWTQGGPQECMGCHTTGYDPETDSWDEDSIHCTACHSPINTEHPDEPMPLTEGMTCTSCHDPHGSSNYRIINEAINGVAVTVTQIDEANKDYDTEQWGAGTSAMCAACHGAYHRTDPGQGSILDAGTYTHHSRFTPAGTASGNRAGQ